MSKRVVVQKKVGDFRNTYEFLLVEDVISWFGIKRQKSKSLFEVGGEFLWCSDHKVNKDVEEKIVALKSTLEDLL